MSRAKDKNDAVQSGTENHPQKDETAMTDAAQIAAKDVDVPKKKGTPPNWKPSGQLPKLKAPPGFSPKWCSVNKLSERRSEGWIVMKPSDNRGDEILNVDVNDVGSLTGALRYRDLVAIMLPKDLKEARDNYIRNENKEAMAGILRETDEKLKENGVQTYAPRGQAGRIVIE